MFIFHFIRVLGFWGRLIDDPLDFKVGDLASVLGGLPPRVVEVSWHRDHGILDVGSHLSLGGLLHFYENKRSNLLWRITLTLSFNPGIAISSPDNLVRQGLEISLSGIVIESPSDEPLAREDGMSWIGDSLSLGRNTHEHLLVIRKCDDRRSCSLTYITSSS